MTLLVRFITLVSVLFSSFFTSLPNVQAQAHPQILQEKNIVNLTKSTISPVLRGIKYDLKDPLKFDFILDKGNAGVVQAWEAQRLVKYFLAGMTVPEEDLWVNLSPYENGRIVPDAFGVTEMGRDLLAQDYLLKQLTASLIYPEGESGKKFWEKVYEQARKRFGTSDIPLDTFNKVWIVPAKAEVYETTHGAYVLESRLKVMLDSDYLAMSNNLMPAAGDLAAGRMATSSLPSTHELTQNIMREIIVPLLEKEVNEGENFSKLRQVYNSLILAMWFKEKMKSTLLGQAYADKRKTDGIDIADKTEKEKIWAQYVESFRKGAYSLVKEETDAQTGEVIPRKYFSGGVVLMPKVQGVFHVSRDAAQLPLREPVDSVEDDVVKVQLALQPTSIPRVGRNYLGVFSTEEREYFNKVIDMARGQKFIGVSKEEKIAFQNEILFKLAEIKRGGDPLFSPTYVHEMYKSKYLAKILGAAYRLAQEQYSDGTSIFKGHEVFKLIRSRIKAFSSEEAIIEDVRGILEDRKAYREKLIPLVSQLQDSGVGSFKIDDFTSYEDHQEGLLRIHKAIALAQEELGDGRRLLTDEIIYKIIIDTNIAELESEAAKAVAGRRHLFQAQEEVKELVGSFKRERVSLLKLPYIEFQKKNSVLTNGEHEAFRAVLEVIRSTPLTGLSMPARKEQQIYRANLLAGLTRGGNPFFSDAQVNSLYPNKDLHSRLLLAYQLAQEGYSDGVPLFSSGDILGLVKKFKGQLDSIDSVVKAALFNMEARRKAREDVLLQQKQERVPQVIEQSAKNFANTGQVSSLLSQLKRDGADIFSPSQRRELLLRAKVLERLELAVKLQGMKHEDGSYVFTPSAVFICIYDRSLKGSKFLSDLQVLIKLKDDQGRPFFTGFQLVNIMGVKETFLRKKRFIRWLQNKGFTGSDTAKIVQKVGRISQKVSIIKRLMTLQDQYGIPDLSRQDITRVISNHDTEDNKIDFIRWLQGRFSGYVGRIVSSKGSCEEKRQHIQWLLTEIPRINASQIAIILSSEDLWDEKERVILFMQKNGFQAAQISQVLSESKIPVEERIAFMQELLDIATVDGIGQLLRHSEIAQCIVRYKAFRKDAFKLMWESLKDTDVSYRKLLRFALSPDEARGVFLEWTKLPFTDWSENAARLRYSLIAATRLDKQHVELIAAQFLDTQELDDFHEYLNTSSIEEQKDIETVQETGNRDFQLMKRLMGSFSLSVRNTAGKVLRYDWLDYEFNGVLRYSLAKSNAVDAAIDRYAWYRKNASLSNLRNNMRVVMKYAYQYLAWKRLSAESKRIIQDGYVLGKGKSRKERRHLLTQKYGQDTMKQVSSEWRGGSIMDPQLMDKVGWFGTDEEDLFEEEGQRAADQTEVDPEVTQSTVTIRINGYGAEEIMARNLREAILKYIKIKGPKVQSMVGDSSDGMEARFDGRKIDVRDYLNRQLSGGNHSLVISDDAAMKANGAVNPTGGIDLTSRAMNLKLRAQSDEEVWVMDDQLLQHLREAQGVKPIIIGTQPLKSSLKVFFNGQD